MSHPVRGESLHRWQLIEGKNKMKYICTDDGEGKQEIFTFPRTVNHDAMAEVLGHIKNQTHGNWKRVFRAPISAGFVDIHGNCIGASETLGLKSRPEDTALLAKQGNE